MADKKTPGTVNIYDREFDIRKAFRLVGKEYDAEVFVRCRSENIAVIVNVDKWRQLNAVYNRMLAAEENPKEFVEVMNDHQSCEEKVVDDTREVDDVLVPEAYQKEKDFELAENYLKEKLNQYPWFVDVYVGSALRYEFDVVVSDDSEGDEIRALIPTEVRVPMGAKVPRHTFTVIVRHDFRSHK